MALRRKKTPALVGAVTPEGKISADSIPGLEELRPGDQDYPVANSNPSMHDKAVRDIAHRRALGVQRYGVALQPANGRDAIRDWYEEALDGVVYGAQVQWEQDNPAETYVGDLIRELAAAGCDKVHFPANTFVPEAVINELAFWNIPVEMVKQLP